MQQNKLCVGVIFGGRSAEHEVSLRSARNIIDALDPCRYDVRCIKIAKDGRWLAGEAALLLQESNPGSSEGAELAISPGAEAAHALVSLQSDQREGRGIDVVFPILHGTFGEDGTVQGLLKLCGIPFVGASVLGSAVGMDKDAMKRLLRDAGLPVAKALVIQHHERETLLYEQARIELGDILFIKPANLGSSVGVCKVRTAEEFQAALDIAFQYDNKLLIEEFIEGREIECAVLGNEDPRASVLGEIIPQHDFYSYEAKYLDPDGALLKIPADLPPDITETLRRMAVSAFKALYCEGMGRVDFLLKGNGEAIVNEINTLPGFTSISMYPKLWEATGLQYSSLIDELIALALRRYERDRHLRIDR